MDSLKSTLRFDIEQRRVFANRYEFGAVGAYERIDAKATIAVDPAAPAQADIVDLDKAPRNGDGRVEFTTDVCILKPCDFECGNRRLLFGYGNRGNKRELQFFNDAPGTNDPLTLDHAGNGFLFRRGYTVVWCAWEGDLLPGNDRMLLRVPVATDDGKPITGVVRTEFIASQEGVTCYPLSGQISAISYPTVSMDTREASLSRRRYAQSQREPVSSDAWCFAQLATGRGMDAQGGEHAMVESDRHIYLRTGFEPGWIYELIYTARDPLVLGLGHVAVRDVVSYLRIDTADSAGQANPLGRIEKTYAWGRSQTGRCIRDFVHAGYNADADGRRVFDGVMPHVSGCGLMWMNHRFANVISMAGQEYESHMGPADRFPFSYAQSTDHLSGVTDAILKRPESDPVVLHTQSSTEYWQRRGSLVHTDTHGADLAQPDNVRVYLWASSQHFASPNPGPASRSITVHYENIVETSMLFRAMLDVMDAWATEGREPPDSRIPRVSDGTLVDYQAWRQQFPEIPGSAVPQRVNACPRLDFGPQFAEGVVSRQPPEVVGHYPVLVPSVDEDGNDVPGVRVPIVQVPLGTYTGWNIRRRGAGHGAMYEFSGSYIPFPDSPEERGATGDPRRSILERYHDSNAYLEAIETAARKLVEARLMLEEDIARVVERAADWGRVSHDVRL